MDIEGVQRKADEVFVLMRERLPVGGRDFEARIRKAGRLLPRRIRRDASYLAEAANLVKNPKLVRMVDFEKLDRAHRDCMEFLSTINVKDRRRATMLSILGSLSFAFLVVVGASIAVLVWQGIL